MATATLSQSERIERIKDPVSFQERLLHRRLWSKQRDIARAVAVKRRTAVKGCHGSGKSFVAAGCVLHHLAMNIHGKVFTIAPTLRQVKLMWEEIELARSQSSIAFPPCSTTGIFIHKDRYGLGFSASKGVNAQGMHGDEVLIITDESPGIQADVWDAIEGIALAGNVRRLELGNPTVPSGPFHENFAKSRAKTECITISAFDTPNLQNAATGRAFTIAELDALSEDDLSYAPFRGLTTRYGVLDRYRRWGPTNPRYISRVLGEFPSQSEHAVFELAWIDRAQREPTTAEIERAKGCLIQVGIDVAGPGDDETTGCARVNGIIIARAAWADKDPRGKVARWLYDVASRSGYQMGTVVVDAGGIGYNFALHLADQGWNVYGFNAGSGAIDREQFVNAKAESYFRLRDMYKTDYVSHAAADCVTGLPTLDEECEAQLSGLEFTETSVGQIKIEPKEEARKRGLASPDRAEAEVLAFARIVPREMVADFTDDAEISPI